MTNAVLMVQAAASARGIDWKYEPELSQGWKDAGWTEVPAVPCNPCFGAVGPNSASWRLEGTEHVRCTGCLLYALTRLTPAEYVHELEHGRGTLTAALLDRRLV